VSVLRGKRVVVRPARPEDAGRLAKIFAEPEVARWWRSEDGERAAAEFVEGEEHVPFAIELDGEVIGGIQYAEEEEDPEYRHAGLDIFLAAAHQGAGLGSEGLRLVARYLIEERGHHRLVIDPAAANARAIRAYERVGFRPVGIMREYEQGADGTWHDGLLMDLLARELR
jgi:aminoglycoside 6'-N-acetyltransferase